MLLAAARKVHKITDYKKSDFNITNVELEFELNETRTIVKSKLQIVRNNIAPLVLNGEKLKLLAVKLNGKEVLEYKVTSTDLTIYGVPEEFALEITVSINPKANAALNGLYVSGGNFATQCEPHGFRCITYYLDRPDVLARFKTKIIADKSKYPKLLANGNLIDSGDFGDKHFALWEDPHPKPSYLFALVAGNLDVVKGTFTTKHGNEVRLEVYVEIGNKDQAEFAITALKKSMAWDEEVYGRVYDLDIYMIVAVSDFNFGAMENKGLNIFNDQYVLAHKDLATDADYENVLGVIGHEYFHNWSGNRVTCRDWFQLSLKEGLTVFRDQSFSADMTSALATRIESVDIIRNVQFAEDAGPMSHAVKPESYVSMNNFYTTTVYNKGAELIRMLKTIVGDELFYKGMDIYFAKNDGCAVTTDEFIAAHEEASMLDFTQFKLWYSQAGTPVVRVSSEYNAESHELALTFSQSCEQNKEYMPMHIPISFGLLGEDGEEIVLEYNNFNPKANCNVIHLTKESETFVLKNIAKEPVLSLLRNFSAPVKLKYKDTLENLITVMLFDIDSFNRYDASNKIMEDILISSYFAKIQGNEYETPEKFLKAFGESIEDKNTDKGLKSHLLMLPDIKTLIMQIPEVKVDVLAEVYNDYVKYLGATFYSSWQKLYDENNILGSYEFSSEAVLTRKLKNVALSYLADSDDRAVGIIMKQFDLADNMTDKIAALAAINNHDAGVRDEIFAKFYSEYKSHPLVVDKWFKLQALSTLPNTLSVVKELMEHPAYDACNPNRVRSLLGSFASGNHLRFHNEEGYALLVDNIIKIDKHNPQLAARLLGPLLGWKFYNRERGQVMRDMLLKITKESELSDDLYEVASKATG